MRHDHNGSPFREGSSSSRFTFIYRTREDYVLALQCCPTISNGDKPLPSDRSFADRQFSQRNDASVGESRVSNFTKQAREQTMPFTRVDLLKGKSAEYRKTVAAVIYEGLIKVMKAPEGDRFTVIQEYEPDNFTYDKHFLGIERTDDVIIIQLYTTVGNSKEQKLGFFRLVADELHSKLGVRKEDVFINIVVCPVHEDWSFGNGDPWA